MLYGLNRFIINSMKEQKCVNPGRSWSLSIQFVHFKDELKAGQSCPFGSAKTHGVTAKGAHSRCATSSLPTPISFRNIYIYI